MDRIHSRHWREPELAPELEPGEAPVVVSVVYTIAPDVEKRFLAAMTKVRLGRLRTGAKRWGLFRDGENPQKFVELFIVRSWDEHLRQHNERLTGADRDIEEQAKVLSDPPPVTTHLLGTEVDS